MSDFMKQLEGLIQAKSAYEEARNNMPPNVGELIGSERKGAGYSQRRLAERLGVDHTYISKIENGALKPGMPFLVGFFEAISDSTG